MAGLRKRFGIAARDFVHAGEASIQVQNLLKSLNIDPQIVRRVALCSYEGEMNVVMHAGDGTLEVAIEDDELAIEVRDPGPGIADIDLAMQPGFSTAPDELREMGFGAGMGLPNMKKNADALCIESASGRGTCVRMRFALRRGGGAGAP
jgi:anti-sigma regulatory factor (Ser/Thr protein kinase)